MAPLYTSSLISTSFRRFTKLCAIFVCVFRDVSWVKWACFKHIKIYSSTLFEFLTIFSAFFYYEPLFHRIARLYVFPIIQGRTVEDCFEEEKTKLANESNSKVTGYISASVYQQLKAKQAATTSTFTSKIKENTYNDSLIKQEQPRSNSKNILQDKLVNIDTSSSSSSGLSMLDKGVGMFKSNSMPSFEEAAKMRARRQISFDNVDFPKRWFVKVDLH